MNVLKDDYIGFSFNNVHSFDLGIMRVSDGSRYIEDLLPASQNITLQIPGRDETYYFGSTYTQKIISVSFVFDGITEQQLEYMRELFGDKKIHPLVFDETPYKKYYAKVTGSSTIKFLAFPEGDTKRVYKGEGTLEFTCYNPYAICDNKDADSYDNTKIQEWNQAANLLSFSNNTLDKLEIDNYSTNIGKISIYNPGIKDTDWKMYFKFEEDGSFPEITIELNGQKIRVGNMSAKTIGIDKRDVGIVFDSKTGLIEGFSLDKDKNTLYKKTNNIYNEFILEGDFFKIPVTLEKTPKGSKRKKMQFNLTFADDSQELNNYYYKIEYSYYYL